MTEAGDKEGKTEEPTHKKITDELDRGNIPLSREAALFASAVALLVINSFLAKDLLSSLTLVLRTIASDPGGWSIENSADAAAFLSKFAWEVAILLHRQWEFLWRRGSPPRCCNIRRELCSTGSGQIQNVYHSAMVCGA